MSDRLDMNELIVRKRDGGRLNDDEIERMLTEYTKGGIPDYQMSAMLMAIYFRGLDRQETFTFTRVMRDSGDVMDLSGIKGIKVDKHSTGGVGDKTTLITGPVAAAVGVPVAKMSGRGLGFTGGTVDKLQSIPGYRTELEPEEFIRQVNSIGIAVISQTGHITPADKKLYALRDVTGTVENLSLIASSIMSKKLASGSDAIVLDVKCGEGAFFKTQQEAEKAAELMMSIGQDAGKKTAAVISGMEQPLGYAIGNSLEVMEAVDVLRGDGPSDTREIALTLAGMMIYLSEKAKSPEDGYRKAEAALDAGSALRKFREMIAAQGGNPDITEDYRLLGTDYFSAEVRADRDGYITSMPAMEWGLASQAAGAGRMSKDDEIDSMAGIMLRKKTGDRVKAGEAVAIIYSGSKDKMERAAEIAENAFTIGDKAPIREPLIKEILGV